MTWSSTVAKVQHCILGSHSKNVFQTISFFWEQDLQTTNIRQNAECDTWIQIVKPKIIFSFKYTAAFNGAYFSGSPIDLLQYYKNILQNLTFRDSVEVVVSSVVFSIPAFSLPFLAADDERIYLNG